MLMGTTGVFGYIIGKKKRLTHVQIHGDMLWEILLREIYVLIKHFGSIEVLQNEFEKIKLAKNKPKPEDIERCKYFMDLDVSTQSVNNWYCLLRGCQNSFINLLEAGYILNQKEEYGYVVIFDFNKKALIQSNKIINMIKVDEIMKLPNMPMKTYNIIVSDLKKNYEIYIERLQIIDEKIEKIEPILIEAKKTENINILKRANNLLYDMNCEKSKLKLEKKDFYERLNSLDMIIKE
jgi:hypothetical protein